MKFAKTLQMTANTLPEEYKGQVLNYKKFKKAINKIVNNLESTGVYEIPENEKCKVIYSLSNKNKNGNEGEIKSSLILYIDKDYVAELSQKDALELNSEEITIDPKLKEVIELAEDLPIEQEKVTKERVIRSFQISDSGKNEFTFNKQLPLRRLSRHVTSDDKDPKSASEMRRNTLCNPSSSKNECQLKRSKSDGDKMANIKLKPSIIKEEEEEEEEEIKMEKGKGKVKPLEEIPLCDEPVDPTSPVTSPVSSPITSPIASPITSPISSPIASPITSPKKLPTTNNIEASSSSTQKEIENNDAVIRDNNNIKDNIPSLNKSDNINITNDTNDVQKGESEDEEVDDVIDCTVEQNNNLSDENAAKNTMKSLQVLLEADAQFLNELAASLSQLSAFQDEYKKVFETKINLMANILSEVSSPNMKDTYRWREILGIYVDSNIWKFRGKDRTPDEVIEQLKLFEKKIVKINKKFKTKKSQLLLKEFIQLNFDIVAIKRFYELNQTAVYKILKKHDKRTHLLASEGFPKFARDETFFKDNIVRSLVFQISSRLLNVIPNPEEYYCPICKEISYKPIRLDCGHLYCLRCLLKAKKLNIRDCPICREPEAVYNADSSNLDSKLMRKLKQEFPREVKEKMIENRSAKAKEESEALLHMYGYGSGPNQCIVM